MDMSLASNLLAKLPEDGLRAGLLNMLDGAVGSLEGRCDVVWWLRSINLFTASC